MIGACSYVPPGSEVPIAIERRGPNGLRILEGRLRLADPAAPECAAARPAAEGFFPPRGALVRALMDLEASAAAEAVHAAAAAAAAAAHGLRPPAPAPSTEGADPDVGASDGSNGDSGVQTVGAGVEGGEGGESGTVAPSASSAGGGGGFGGGREVDIDALADAVLHLLESNASLFQVCADQKSSVIGTDPR